MSARPRPIDPAMLRPGHVAFRWTSTGTSTAAGSTPTRCRPSTARGARSTRSHERNQELLHQLLQDAAATPQPDGHARPDGGRLLRRRDGRGGDRRGRGDAARAATWRASTRPRSSPTSARIAHRPAAHRRRARCTRWASRPTSRTRTPTSSTWARAGWACPSATTTRATTSTRSRFATAVRRPTSPISSSNLGDARTGRRASGRRAHPRLRDAPGRGVLYRRARCATCSSRMNRHDVAALDELMPGFGLSALRRRARRHLGRPSTSTTPASSRRSTSRSPTPPSRRCATTSAGTSCRSFASALSPAFENEAFDFYGRRWAGSRSCGPAGSACSTPPRADIGEQVAQLYVDAAFSQAAKKRCEEMVGPPPLGDGRRDPRAPSG